MELSEEIIQHIFEYLPFSYHLFLIQDLLIPSISFNQIF